MSEHDANLVPQHLGAEDAQDWAVLPEGKPAVLCAEDEPDHSTCLRAPSTTVDCSFREVAAPCVDAGNARARLFRGPTAWRQRGARPLAD